MEWSPPLLACLDHLVVGKTKTSVVGKTKTSVRNINVKLAFKLNLAAMDWSPLLHSS